MTASRSAAIRITDSQPTTSDVMQASQHFAKAVRECLSGNPVVSHALEELGLVNAKVFVIHEKGTDNYQVNVSFDLVEGDNVEGVARKFGMGLIPMVLQQLQKKGVMDEPAMEFFCIPQSPEHQKDSVVAIFSFDEHVCWATRSVQVGTTQPPLN